MVFCILSFVHTVHVNHEGMLCVCLTTLTVLTVLVYAYCVTELTHIELYFHKQKWK